MPSDRRSGLKSRPTPRTAAGLLRLDLPGEDWSLRELHDIGRTAAEATGVLTELTIAVDVRVASLGLGRV